MQLAYTRIVAPIDGRTGIRQVDEGNIVHACDATGLVVLTQLQPIAVVFTLPEQYARRESTRSRRSGPLQVDRAERRTDKTCSTRASSLLVDNQIDVTTGTMRLKALFPNQDHELWPGQFVNARLLLDGAQGRGRVPAPAGAARPTGTFAFVIKGGPDRRDAAVSRRRSSRARR